VIPVEKLNFEYATKEMKKEINVIPALKPICGSRIKFFLTLLPGTFKHFGCIEKKQLIR